ncbi:MAG: hypothetical protein U0929_17390 [Planctomycetaceae bacterium]
MRIVVFFLFVAFVGGITWTTLISKPADFWFYEAIRNRRRIEISSIQLDGQGVVIRTKNEAICDELSAALAQCEEEDYTTRKGYLYFNSRRDFTCDISIFSRSGEVWTGYAEIQYTPCRVSFEIQSAGPVEPGWPTHTIEIKQEVWPQLYELFRVTRPPPS